MPAAPGTPETDDQIRAWEQYRLAAQAALRHPPNEAKPEIDDLASRLRHLAKVERILVLSVRQNNKPRLRITKMQEEVLQALGWKYLQRDRGTFQPDTFCLNFATTLRQGLCVSSHAVFCFPSARP